MARSLHRGLTLVTSNLLLKLFYLAFVKGFISLCSIQRWRGRTKTHATGYILRFSDAEKTQLRRRLLQ